jgi:hypothetical protein
LKCAFIASPPSNAMAAVDLRWNSVDPEARSS